MVDLLSPVPAIDFQGKDRSEKFHFYFRQHWIRLFSPFVKMLAWTAGITAISFAIFGTIGQQDSTVRHLTLLLLTGLFLYSQFEFLNAFYKYFLYVVVVTDKKAHRIKKTLITTDEHQSIDLWMIQDINKAQCGIIQNILGYGSITLEAQETIVRLHFVPHISKQYERFMSLKERSRAIISGRSQQAKDDYLEKTLEEEPHAPAFSQAVEDLL